MNIVLFFAIITQVIFILQSYNSIINVAGVRQQRKRIFITEVFLIMAESRLIGGYPVIGIRPTIDGRRGPLKVRESLEDQTMGMVQMSI